jgi:peptidyl-dipeptidase Dcp
MKRSSRITRRNIEASSLAKENKEGWIFTLDHPSYVPFMNYDNRALRKLAIAFWRRGFQRTTLTIKK